MLDLFNRHGVIVRLGPAELVYVALVAPIPRRVYDDGLKKALRFKRSCKRFDLFCVILTFFFAFSFLFFPSNRLIRLIDAQFAIAKLFLDFRRGLPFDLLDLREFDYAQAG